MHTTIRAVREGCQRGVCCAAVLLATAWASPAPAAAQSVYVNGSDVTGAVRDLEVTDVERLVFDADGHVHILAPSIDLRGADGEAFARDNRGMAVVLGGTWWLLTVPAPDGAVPDRIAVVVNGELVATLEPDGPQIVEEITGHLVLGENTVTFQATRLEPSNGSVTNPLRVIIGRGERRDGAVELNEVAATFERSAASEDAESTASVQFMLSVPDPPTTP